MGEERGGEGALSYLTVIPQIIYILIGLKIQLSGGPEGTRLIESNPNQNLNVLIGFQIPSNGGPEGTRSMESNPNQNLDT